MVDNQSFLPEDYLEKRAQRRTNFFSLTLFIIVMAGVVGAYFVTDQQRRDVQAMQVQVNNQFEEAARRLDQFEQLQARREQMIHKAQVTGTLIERVPRSVLLAELINCMPPNLSLLDMKVDTKVVKSGPAPTTAIQRAQKNKKAKEEPKFQAPETEVSITLTGVAPTDVQVSQFMTMLGHNPMFANQHLGYSEETTVKGQKMRKFRVDIELAPGVDVQHHQPRLVKRESIPNPMGSTMELNLENQLEKNNVSQQRSDVLPSND